MNLNKEQIKIIEENPIAIATSDNANNPHVSVAAFVKVNDKKLVITNNYMNNTIKNIEENNKISIVVWNKDWKGLQMKGIAEYFSSGKWFDFVKSLKENKNEPCRGVIVVSIAEIKEIG